RITKLISSLEVDGTNADVRVRNVSPTVSLIKLDDKYADVRIPLRNTKNYSLDFTGSYSSVYGNFEKKPVAATEEKKQTTSSGSASGTGTVMATTVAEAPVVSGVRLTQLRTLNAAGGWNEGNGPSKFTAIVGDGKGLKLDIKCQNCTVDFK
ncbi:MAG: hypothetical protein JWQ78_333, partial [Sediminibacterium sp.]|nr:hypothetical protein [Sediminibacterium sp.]